MHIQLLTQMANDIAQFFAAEPDHASGVNGVADHLTRFWDPTMRKQLIGHLAAGGEGLQPMAREAVQQLANKQKPLH